MQNVNRLRRPAGDQRVVGRAELFFELSVAAVLHAFDLLLRLLDPHADLKRLGRHRHAACEASISYVSRALWPMASTTTDAGM